MSHLPLDARAILDYLNDLGYRNISADQLKEFMKDLRKLIKYEETLGINANQDNYFESLFKRTTASFRAKITRDKEHGTRAVEVKSKREHERHALRPLGQLPRRQQLDSKEQPSQNHFTTVMAKRGPPKKPAPKSAVGEHSESSGRRADTKRQTQQKQQTQAQSARSDPGLPSKSSIGVGNLSREAAWQTNSRTHLKECKDFNLRISECDASEHAQTRASSTKLTAEREASLRGSHTSSVSSEPSGKGVPAKTSATATLAQPKEGTTTGRTRNATTSEERGATAHSSSGATYTAARSLGVIIPRYCTATRRRRPLSTDPVALYHYYQSEWKYFREQIPGDSLHMDLRWLIRARLVDQN